MKLTKKSGKIISILLVLIMLLPFILSCEDTNDIASTIESEKSDDTITSWETITEPVTVPATELPTDPEVKPEPDEYGIISGFRYFIKSFHSGLYLTVDGDYENAGFTQEEFTGDSSQMFVFTKIEGRNYTIRALGTKASYLDTQNGDGKRDGAFLEVTETPSADGSHEWSIRGIGETYAIRSKISSNTRAIDVQDFSIEPGGRVFLWIGGTQVNQRWFLELAADKLADDAQ